MSQEHDDWMKDALGIDLGQLPQIAAGTGAPPVSDPGLQAAVIDTVTQFGKGVAKGASNTALGIVNSPAGQVALGPLGTTENVLNAVISDDPSKLAPSSFGIPDAKTINDPKAQATAVAQAQGLVRSVVDPIGFEKDAAIASATVAATGDPEQVGEATGKGAVIIGATVAGGVGELGIVGETGAAGAAGDAGAAGATGLPPELPPPSVEPTPVGSLGDPLGLPPDTIPDVPQFPSPKLPGEPITPEPIPKLPGGPKEGPPIPREDPVSGPVDTQRQPIDIPGIPEPPATIPDGPITLDAPTLAPDTIPDVPQFPSPKLPGEPIAPEPIPKLPGGPKEGPPIPREDPVSGPVDTQRQPIDIP